MKETRWQETYTNINGYKIILERRAGSKTPMTMTAAIVRWTVNLAITLGWTLLKTSLSSAERSVSVASKVAALTAASALTTCFKALPLLLLAWWAINGRLLGCLPKLREELFTGRGQLVPQGAPPDRLMLCCLYQTDTESFVKIWTQASNLCMSDPILWGAVQNWDAYTSMTGNDRRRRRVCLRAKLIPPVRDSVMR